MKQFKKDLFARMQGTPSMEANHDDDLTMGGLPASIATFTAEEVDQVEDGRALIIEDAIVENDINSDLTDIDQTVQTVGVITDTAATVANSRPVDGEVISSVTNTVVNDMANAAGITAPKLVCDDNGAIEAASMEGFMDWTKRMVTSVAASTGRFFTRLGMGFSRLSQSTQTLSKRSSKARGLLLKRKGTGGKAIRLKTTTKELLVVNEGWSKDIAGDLNAFASLVGLINPVLLDLHKRVTDLLQASLANKVSGGNGLSILSGINTDDLVAKLNSILGDQGVLLGNSKFELTPGTGEGLWTLTIRPQVPYASSIVGHLDPLNSLTTEEAQKLLGDIEKVLRLADTQIDTSVQAAVKSGSLIENAVRRIDSRVNRPVDDGEVDYFDDDINLGSEYELLIVLGKIESKLITTSNALNRRIDAALQYVEESAFQD